MAYSKELYQQVILDHNKKPKNFGKLEEATGFCCGNNPLCGDQIVLYVKFDGQNIQDIRFNGNGCAISKASSSLLTVFAKGKEMDAIITAFDQFTGMVKGEFDPNSQESVLGKLKLFEGIKEYPARTKCATLAWHALKCALEDGSETSTE